MRGQAAWFVLFAPTNQEGADPAFRLTAAWRNP